MLQSWDTRILPTPTSSNLPSKPLRVRYFLACVIQGQSVLRGAVGLACGHALVNGSPTPRTLPTVPYSKFPAKRARYSRTAGLHTATLLHVPCVKTHGIGDRTPHQARRARVRRRTPTVFPSLVLGSGVRVLDELAPH